MFQLLHQKPEAKKADHKEVKPAAKALPAIPGMDSKLFKQAMAEQKSHGVEMKGPRMGRCARHLCAVLRP